MDLSIDLNTTSPNFGDLLVINGDVVFTSDKDTRGTNYVLQSIVQRLRLFLGEWFLNTSLGVPYFQQILIKNPNAAAVDTILQNTVLGTPGVLRLTSWSSSLDRPHRIVSVRFGGRAVNGPFNYSGPLNFPNDQVRQ